MDHVLDAIYEGGVFEPLERPDLPEHQQVTLTVHLPPVENPDGELEAWRQVYEGFSDQDLADMESMLEREHVIVERGIRRWTG